MNRAFLILLLAFALTSCTAKIEQGAAQATAEPDAVHMEADALHGEIQNGALQGRVEIAAPVSVASGAVHAEMHVVPTVTLSPQTSVSVTPAPGTFQGTVENGAVQIMLSPETFKSEWKPNFQVTVPVPEGAVQIHVDCGQVGWALAVAILLLSGAISYAVVSFLRPRRSQ